MATSVVDGIGHGAASRRYATIEKPVSAHTLRHSFATLPIESGYGIRTVRYYWSTRALPPCKFSIHVLNRGEHGVLSPLDRE